MSGVEYRYEVWRADEVVATGHLNRDWPLEVGDRVEIGSQRGIVRAIEPQLHQRAMRLVVQLLPERI